MKNNKMYALGNQFYEGCFFNFKDDEDADEMSLSCLLPTYEMADHFREENLGFNYFIHEIELVYYSDDEAVFEYSMPKQWE
ncbi:hypothetical protein D3C77_537010 [compost metagenome]